MMVVVRGAVTALMVAVLMGLAGSLSPAPAQNNDGFRFFQFFDRGPQWMPWQPWRPWQPQTPPWRQQQQPQTEPRQVIDYSKAPPPRRLEGTPPLRAVVMGDAMADWLAYGLEEAFGDNPEVGIIRKHHASSGLIHGESRSAYDWPSAAREILAAEPVNFIVVMIGMADRQQPIRERASRSASGKTGQNAQRGEPGAEAAKGEDAAANPDEAPPAGAEAARSSGGTYEFHSEKWAEAYAKRIDELIAVLKSKGVPVFWVGLPSLRGQRSTADMAYLNDLYRSRAEKAGITFVDIWDGFVDENGSFTMQGPDFEGQTRRLRSGDGVYFTKAGARKLAHYVEREIRRAMQGHETPVAMPAPEEPQSQSQAARPGTPSRPAAGPVVLLTTLSGSQEGLLGGGSARATPSDPSAAKVLVKGEPAPGLSGRADDFSWPRGEGMLSPGASAPVTQPAAPQSPPPEKSEVTPEQPAAAPKPANATTPAASPTPAKPRRGTAHGTAQRRQTNAQEPRNVPFFADQTPRPPGLIPR